MVERFKLKSAVYLVLKQDNKVLLMKRAGSGYMDGFYSLPAGHLEQGETLKMAMVREAKEEINIEIDPRNLHLELTLHRASEFGEYIDVFFSVQHYKNELRINEPDKCHDLGFFDVEKMDKPIVPYIRKVLECLDKKINYLEADWDIYGK